MKNLSLVCVIALALPAAIGMSRARAGERGCEIAADCTAEDCGGAVCNRCGAGCAHKVCRLVCTEKEITVTCYGVKCKEICVPSCGSKCITTECVRCGEPSCGCGGDGAVCKARYATGKPGCARPKCVKQLVKYEATKKVPAYEWQVVYVCDACRDSCGEEACAVLPGESEQAYAPLPPPSR